MKPYTIKYMHDNGPQESSIDVKLLPCVDGKYRIELSFSDCTDYHRFLGQYLFGGRWPNFSVDVKEIVEESIEEIRRA